MSGETRIRAQIASMAELGRVVTAMRSLAAAELQACDRALPGIRRYAEILADAMASARTLLPERSDGDAGAPRLVVIGTERGFVGAFDERLLDRAATEPGPYWIVGARAAQLAQARHLAIEHVAAMPTRATGVFPAARALAAELEQRVAAGELVRLAALASRRDGDAISIRRVPLLPLAAALPSEHGTPPRHHLAPLALVARIAGERILGELVHVMMESFAAENTTRLRAMTAARHHVDDRLHSLGALANQLRQDEITDELLDVVTGAAAVQR